MFLGISVDPYVIEFDVLKNVLEHTVRPKGVFGDLEKKRFSHNYSLTASWLRRKICFALMNSVCICVRGSRSVFPSHLEDSLSVDLTVSEITSRVH